MAPSRAAQPLRYIFKPSVARPCPSFRAFTTSTSFHADQSESALPRVATTSFWSGLIPRPLRRLTDPVEAAERAKAKAARKAKGWNPATFYVVFSLLIGSNAINIIALRNETLNFSRKTDAKLTLLREVVQRVKNGEDVDVEKLLGTGDEASEKEWEEVMHEVESTDMLAQKREKKEARHKEKVEAADVKKEERRKAKLERDAKRVEENPLRESSAATIEENGDARRPKFWM